MEKDSHACEEVEPPGSKFTTLDLFTSNDTPPGVSLWGINSPKIARHLTKFKVNSKTNLFLKKFFPSVTIDEWNDWQWQLSHRITELKELKRFINLTDDEQRAITNHRGPLPVSITPYYLSLISADDSIQPLRRTVIPVCDEFIHSPAENVDPLGEENQSPIPGLIHRYPDRVLFLVTDFCSANCRYCTRSRMVGRSGHSCFSEKQWEKAINYIKKTTSVRDVLISGGDPLTLSDDKLEWLLSRLRRINHVEFLRIGTKVPVVLPQRVTLTLTRMLKKYHPLWMSIHFTHPEELTPETVQACGRLADAGIPLGSQTVLLSGINDNVETMKKLMHGLLKARVKPYYLYQCDPIPGSSHFRTSVEKGIEIIRGLRGHTSGYAVPTYVIDAPGGGGKIPVSPNYIAGHDGDNLLLRNYEGNLYTYPAS